MTTEIKPYEIDALRSDVARLERAIRELRAANDGLCSRVQILEESSAQHVQQWHQDNGQFGVGT